MADTETRVSISGRRIDEARLEQVTEPDRSPQAGESSGDAVLSLSRLSRTVPRRRGRPARSSRARCGTKLQRPAAKNPVWLPSAPTNSPPVEIGDGGTAVAGEAAPTPVPRAPCCAVSEVRGRRSIRRTTPMTTLGLSRARRRRHSRDDSDDDDFDEDEYHRPPSSPAATVPVPRRGLEHGLRRHEADFRRRHHVHAGDADRACRRFRRAPRPGDARVLGTAGNNVCQELEAASSSSAP